MQFLDRIQIKERHLETTHVRWRESKGQREMKEREGESQRPLCVGRRRTKERGGSRNENKKEWKTKAISSFELTEPNQSVWK